MNQQDLIDSVRARFAAAAVPYDLLREEMVKLWDTYREKGMKGLRAEWRQALVTVLLVIAYITSKSDESDALLFGSQVDSLASDEEMRYRMHVIAVGCNEEPVPVNAFMAGPLGGLRDVVIQAFIQRVLDALWSHIETMNIQQILDLLAEKLGDLIND